MSGIYKKKRKLKMIFRVSALPTQIHTVYIIIVVVLLQYLVNIESDA